MHTLVILAVTECETSVEAKDDADTWFSDVDWSDWHEVGGRWDGYLPDNALRIGDNKELAKKVLQTVLDNQQSYAASMATKILGLPTAVEDIETFGLGSVDVEAVRRTKQQNIEFAQRMNDVLLKCVNKTYDDRESDYLMGSVFKGFGGFLFHTFEPDSGFVDTSEWDPSPRNLLENLEGGDIDNIWLVVIDAHY